MACTSSKLQSDLPASDAKRNLKNGRVGICVLPIQYQLVGSEIKGKNYGIIPNRLGI